VAHLEMDELGQGGKSLATIFFALDEEDIGQQIPIRQIIYSTICVLSVLILLLTFTLLLLITHLTFQLYYDTKISIYKMLW